MTEEELFKICKKYDDKMRQAVADNDFDGIVSNARKVMEYHPSSFMKQEFLSKIIFFYHCFGHTDDQIKAVLDEYSNLAKYIIPCEYDIEDKRRRNKKAKRKIGYLSVSFRENIVTYFDIQLFAGYDRDKYEVYLFSVGDVENKDAVTEQLQGLVDGYFDLWGMGYAEAAQLIKAQDIDILFDLDGHTSGGRTLILCNFKPAPIIICGIGWFNTTGLKQIDYFLTDNYCCPPGIGDEDFNEELIRLPHTHFCYTPPERALEADGSYQVHDNIVFGSFNNFKKLSPEVFDVWVQIIRQVPGAKLLLKFDNGLECESGQRVFRMAKTAGFTDEQLEFRAADRTYLSEYRDMDIALDPFPYPGGGTTCEALYMGVPVITLIGNRHGARFGYSLLSNMGLGELTAKTKADYINIAVALASDKELLQALRGQIRRMMQQSPLMNGRQYVAEMEAAYEKIWHKYMLKG